MIMPEQSPSAPQPQSYPLGFKRGTVAAVGILWGGTLFAQGIGETAGLPEPEEAVVAYQLPPQAAAERLSTESHDASSNLWRGVPLTGVGLIALGSLGLSRFRARRRS
jgi:hypothetical protein